MRVLVTGGGGFIGQHVLRELSSRGHDVIAPTRDQLDLLIPPVWVATDNSRAYSGSSSIALAISNNDCEAVVHLAATCGGIGINKDNPGKFIYENLQMGINVLEGARIAKIKKLVNLGTVCAYPKFTEIPFREENLWNGYPEETNAPYGIAKKTIMEMGIAYSRQYGMDITNLVPANMAGEYDHFDLYSSHVIPALIRKFEEAQSQAVYADVMQIGREQAVDKVLASIPNVELWGTGSASREFLYAGDCATAIALALEKNTGPEPINLGTGRETTIRNVAMLIKHIGNYDAQITWDETKPNGQPRRCIDTTRAREVLGWEATTSLETMLVKVIDWYRSSK